VLIGVASELRSTLRQLDIDEIGVEAAWTELSMMRWRGRWTTTCGRAALVVTCGGGVSGVCQSMEFLDEVRGGQNAHRRRRIDNNGAGSAVRCGWRKIEIWLAQWVSRDEVFMWSESGCVLRFRMQLCKHTELSM
jgi:hypothetical protein